MFPNTAGVNVFYLNWHLWPELSKRIAADIAMLLRESTWKILHSKNYFGYMEWIVSRDLLYSSGKSTQCSVITCMDMDICICMVESLCSIPEISTTFIANQRYFKKIK